MFAESVGLKLAVQGGSGFLIFCKYKDPLHRLIETMDHGEVRLTGLSDGGSVQMIF